MRNLKRTLHILIFLLVFSSSHVLAQPLNTSFDDDQFYTCVIDNLNEQQINGVNNRVAEQYIATDQELSILPNLTCISYQISSTKGIEKLAGVTYLDFEDNNIKTINLENNLQVTYLYVDKDVIVQGYDGQIEREETQMGKSSQSSLNLMIPLVIGGVIYIIFTVELMILFARFNEKKWKAFIPIYNYIVLLKIADYSVFHILLLLIPIINIWILYKIGVHFATELEKSKVMAIVFAILPIIGIPLLLTKTRKRLSNTNSNFSNMQSDMPNVTVQSQPIGMVDLQMNAPQMAEVSNGNPQVDMMNQMNTPQMTEVPNINPQVDMMNQMNTPQMTEVPNINPQMDMMNQMNAAQMTEVPNMQSQAIENSGPSQDEYRICPKCQNKIRRDAKVCFICGNHLD